MRRLLALCATVWTLSISLVQSQISVYPHPVHATTFAPSEWSHYSSMVFATNPLEYVRDPCLALLEASRLSGPMSGCKKTSGAVEMSVFTNRRSSGSP